MIKIVSVSELKNRINNTLDKLWSCMLTTDLAKIHEELLTCLDVLGEDLVGRDLDEFVDKSYSLLDRAEKLISDQKQTTSAPKPSKTNILNFIPENLRNDNELIKNIEKLVANAEVKDRLNKEAEKSTTKNMPDINIPNLYFEDGYIKMCNTPTTPKKVVNKPAPFLPTTKVGDVSYRTYPEKVNKKVEPESKKIVKSIKELESLITVYTVQKLEIDNKLNLAYRALENVRCKLLNNPDDTLEFIKTGDIIGEFEILRRELEEAFSYENNSIFENRCKNTLNDFNKVSKNVKSLDDLHYLENEFLGPYGCIADLYLVSKLPSPSMNAIKKIDDLKAKIEVEINKIKNELSVKVK